MLSNRGTNEQIGTHWNTSIQLIHLTGCEKRYRPSKHYVYILDVHWSDATVHQIYRKYSDFFKFHVSLFELFPEESGKYDTTERILPFLPGRKFFQEEVEKIAAQRRIDLDEYCRELMKLDGRISQHQKVKKFFEARNEDINPPIDARMKPERSIFMKAFELIPFVSGRPCKKHRSPHNTPRSMPRSKSMPVLDVPEDTDMCISEPILLQTYRAIADYKGDTKTDLSLTKNQLIDVIEKINNGWWLAQNEYGQGWVPASYLDPVSHDTEIDAPEPLLNYEQYLVIKGYEADLDDEITIKKGAIVNVMHKLLDGWWIIHHNGKVGFVPATYLTPYGSCGSLHSGLTGSSSSLESPVIAQLKSPTQRRCTIKSRKASDKAKQNSLDQLSMCRKISVKLEQRKKRQATQPMQCLAPVAPNTSSVVEDDYDYENGDVIEHIGQSRILGLDASVPSSVSVHTRTDKLKQFVAIDSRVPATDSEDALDYEIVDGLDNDYLHPIATEVFEANKLKAKVAAPHAEDLCGPSSRCREYYNIAGLQPRDNHVKPLSSGRESPAKHLIHVNPYENDSVAQYKNIPNVCIRKHRKTLEPPTTHSVNQRTMVMDGSTNITHKSSENSINQAPKPSRKPKPLTKSSELFASRIAKFEGK